MLDILNFQSVLGQQIHLNMLKFIHKIVSGESTNYLRKRKDNYENY
jgi:hypothetical protein